MEDFTYTALQPGHIRLFTLQEDSSGRVSGSLVETPLEDAGEYIALSYAWGDLSQLHEISCNGKALRVHSNLYSCLQRLRLYERRSLWIDALCIDQNSDEEKNHQIPIMMQIYKTAIVVFIWLGDATEEEEDAVFEISGITATLDGIDMSYPLTSRFDLWTSLGLPGPGDRVWVILRGIIARTWFERLWPLQEVAVAQSLAVLIGRKAVVWEIFTEFFDALDRHEISGIMTTEKSPGIRGIGLSQVWNLDVVRNGLNSSRLPPELLSIIRDKRVTNPVDKIYGILGILNLKLEEPLMVDVTSSVVEVYTEFAKQWVTQDPSLSLLSSTSAKDGLYGLPSWCPNFNSDMLSIPLSFVAPWTGYHSGYLSDRDRTCSITLIPDSNYISVPGIDMDKVEETIALEYLSDDSAFDMRHILDWEAACLALSRKVYRCEGDQGIPEAHWQTLIADKYRIGFKYKPQWNQTVLFDEYFKWKRILNHDLGVDLSEYPTAYITAVDGAALGRRFFSTAGGRIGLGPLEMQAGDSVSILYGGSTPYILRKERDSDIYKLVGESYVHGLMYGEALEMRDQGLVTETTFTIS